MPQHNYRLRSTTRESTIDNESDTSSIEEEILRIEDMTDNDTTMETQPNKKFLNRKVEVLSTLDPEKVKEFQHSFEYTNAIGSRKTMMTKKVLEAIEAEDVNINNEEQIKQYLDKIVDEDIKGTTKAGYRYMKEQLTWPKTEGSLTNKINSFIREALVLKRYVKNYKTDQRVKEDVFHLIRRKLPYRFGVKKDLIREKPEVLDIKKLGEELKLRAWAVETKKPKTKSALKKLEKRVMQKLRESNLLPTDSEGESDSDTEGNSDREDFNKQNKTKKIRRMEADVEYSDNSEAFVAQVNRLTNELQKPKCYECGSSEHFRAQCPLRMNTERQLEKVKEEDQPTKEVKEKLSADSTNQYMLKCMSRMMETLDTMQKRYDNGKMNERTTLANRGPYNYQNRGPGDRFYRVNRLAIGTILPRATVQVLNPQNRWTTVNGILDSGSGTTVGSLQHHKSLFRFTRPVRNNVKIQLVNKQAYKAQEVGRIRLKVIDTAGNEREFKEEVLVFLVDDPEWTELIIGFPTLRRENLLPEQQINNNQA